MTREELGEAIGLLARWDHRADLKLTASERYWIRHRLDGLGVDLELIPLPPKEAA